MQLNRNYQMMDSLKIEPIMLGKWKNILDLIVEVMQIPVALIMRVHAAEIEVFEKSGNNEYISEKGVKFERNAGLYSEYVINTKQELILPNALKEKQWQNSPGAALGLIAYMGFPILWPSGEIFGTICVLDSKERAFSELHKKLLGQYAVVIQDDLTLLQTQQQLLENIAQQTKANLTIKQSEEQFRKVFRSAAAALVIAGFDSGEIIDANESFLRLVSSNAEEVLGNTAYGLNLIDEDEREGLICILLTEGKVRDYETTFHLKSGEKKNVLLSMTKIVLNNTECTLSTIYDITLLKRMEDDINILNERLLLAAKSAEAGIWDLDMQSNTLVWNEQMFEIYGSSKAEFTGKLESFQSWIHPEDTEKNIFNKLKTGDHAASTEFRIIRKDGAIRNIEAHASIIDNSDGTPLRIVGVNFDITDQKNLEADLTKSRDNFQTLYDNMEEGVALHKLIFEHGEPVDYCIIDVNPKFETLLRLKRSDVKGKRATEVYDTNNPPYLEEYSQVALSGQPIRFETHFQPYEAYFDVSAAPWGENGFSTIFTDITERVKSEKALLTNEKRLNRAQSMAHVGNWEIDLKTGLMWASEEAFRIYGLPYTTWLELKTAQQAVLEKDRPKMDLALQQLIKNNEPYNVEFNIQRGNDGQIRMLHSMAEVEYSPEHLPVRIVGVVLDITDMKKSEENLIASEQRYRHLFHNSAAVQLIFDVESGSIYDANEAACLFYGFTQAELKSKKIWDINANGETHVRENINGTNRDGSRYFDTQHIRGGGEITDVEVFYGRVDIDGRNMICAIIHDITAKKQAQRELIESEERFRQLVERAPDAIFVQMDYHFAYVNKKTIEIFGAQTKSDLVGQYIPDFLYGEFREMVLETIKYINEEKTPVPVREEIIRRLNGEPLHVEVSAVPFRYNNKDGALVFMHDITKRKNIEKENFEMEIQLRQKQKLESIGTLAGGVAHEINNPINGIINYAQLISENESADHQVIEFCKEIIHEGQRIAEIVKNLLSFARQERTRHSPAQVSDIVNQTISLINTILRRDQIVLAVNIPDGLPSINCRSQQIQQVIMNLITNARDTLNQKYSGFHEDKKIIIDCSPFEKLGQGWIRMTVEDHGAGIPENIRDKIFDPFFSTKPRYEGTGLGLSISHGIVKDHHGELYFESVPGEFTRAVLELPENDEWVLE